jgi:glycosyltransferase involved in cell wall biosynthesis
MISFIVPAHNEQARLGRTRQAIFEAARDIGEPFETIVVDDTSTCAWGSRRAGRPVRRRWC